MRAKVIIIGVNYFIQNRHIRSYIQFKDLYYGNKLNRAKTRKLNDEY